MSVDKKMLALSLEAQMGQRRASMLRDIDELVDRLTTAKERLLREQPSVGRLSGTVAEAVRIERYAEEFATLADILKRLNDGHYDEEVSQ